MPQRCDIEVVQGDDASWIVNVSHPDGTPADLTGYTAQAQIRRDVADYDSVIVASLVTLVSPPYVQLSLPHAQTATLTGNYVWDMQLTDAAGKITTILQGRVSVTQEVTR